MFITKSDLLGHIKSNHEANVMPCKYFLEGRCMFSDEVCWYSHDLNANSNSIIKNKYVCKYCDQVFQSKNELMKHRIVKHFQSVALCRDDINNECKHKDECWYRHEMKITNTHENTTKHSEDQSMSETDISQSSILFK